MPKTEAQYEALRAASQEKIQAAAVTLFARKGFAATNMRDIAARAGISAGLIYRHYPTKEDLFGSLVSQAAVGLGRVADRFRADASPAALIREFTEEFVADVAVNSGSAEFVLIMNHAFALENEPAEVRDLFDQHAALVRAFADLVGRGQHHGEIRDGDAMEMVRCYMATLSGLAMLRVGNVELPGASVLLRFLIKGDEDD